MCPILRPGADAHPTGKGFRHLSVGCYSGQQRSANPCFSPQSFQQTWELCDEEAAMVSSMHPRSRQTPNQHDLCFAVDQILKRHQQDESTTMDDERMAHIRELEASKSSTSLKPHHFNQANQASSSRLSLPEGLEAPRAPTLSTFPINSKHNPPNQVRSMLHYLTRKVVSRVRPGSPSTAGTTLQSMW